MMGHASNFSTWGMEAGQSFLNFLSKAPDQHGLQGDLVSKTGLPFEILVLDCYRHCHLLRDLNLPSALELRGT